MRTLVLSAVAACLLASPALAQSGPPDAAPLPHRQVLSMEMPSFSEDAALQAAVAATTRPEADRARDGERHPFETLTFWGLTPGSTIVEIQPGAGGWWSAILQPYAEATGGTYVAVNRPQDGMGIADGTADMVLVARAFHNWARDGRTQPYLQAFFKALKPGGVLAVDVGHRDPQLSVVVAAVPDFHDVGVPEFGGEIGFAGEPLPETQIRG